MIRNRPIQKRILLDDLGSVKAGSWPAHSSGTGSHQTRIHRLKSFEHENRLLSDLFMTDFKAAHLHEESRLPSGSCSANHSMR